MEELLFCGYCRYCIKTLIPLDIINIISAYSQGRDGTLIIKQNEKKILKSDHEYEFTSIIIENGGYLTTNEWQSQKKCGGKLIISVMLYFIINKGGCVDLSGCGYRGGRDTWTGESYNKPSISQGENNVGGGGGGGYNSRGGGGGYGTCGQTNLLKSREYDNGGCIYGDKYLNILCLGSGGGGHGGYYGGNGGGALQIHCVKFKNYGKIMVNGENAKSYGTGCGSGGAIKIKCMQFEMNYDDNNHDECYIHANGGINTFAEQEPEHGGDGGLGRIRITVDNVDDEEIVKKCVENGRIVPLPYIG